MNLLLGIPTRPFASVRRARGLARGTACAVFRNELLKDFRLAHRMGNKHCSINLEDQQSGRARFWSDSCSHQHRSVYPGLDAELSFSICTTRVCHKSLLLTCDVTFDARFLHSYHVASVQAHVSVNLVDGAVCVESVLVAT